MKFPRVCFSLAKLGLGMGISWPRNMDDGPGDWMILWIYGPQAGFKKWRP
jgi:hypothetical protein